jgi:endogenous inhibitor of DNA gyrase (YacG/DUF329 family)
MSCPMCEQKSVSDYRPFCSRRCADLDLGNWLTGRYAVPSDDPEDTGELSQTPSESDPRLH